MAQLFAAQPANDLPQVPNYNICPTNTVHTVHTDDAGQRRLVPMRWGFLPKWYKTPNGGPLLINARSESIAEKPAFRDAARKRRAIVVASGFYEWTKTSDGARDPWYIAPIEPVPLAMAAVWQDWLGPDKETMRTCAIVTTEANSTMRAIHHRMPVILAPQDWALWLGEAGHGAATLMTAAPEDALAFHRVDRAVNSNRAHGPHLIDAI